MGEVQDHSRYRPTHGVGRRRFEPLIVLQATLHPPYILCNGYISNLLGRQLSTRCCVRTL